MSRIFISHSSGDAAAAAEMKRRLAAIGHVSVFLDFDPANGIPAGRNWEQELYRAVRACRAVIVLCSRRSMESRWCFMEITYARALGKHLFPVKVESCDLTGVVTDVQAIDLVADPDSAYARLERGLLAAGLDPAAAHDWDGSRAPYPGLLAFQSADAAVFFGREMEIDEGLDLVNRLRRLAGSGLVLVVGASGVGKSSLVRAGLVPRLRKDAESWLVVEPFRPRDDPTRELAAALGRTLQQLTGQSYPWQELSARLRDGRDEASLARSAEALRELCHELRLASGRAEAQMLLIVDQLEELLGHAADDPRIRFLRILRGAMDDPGCPLLVLATLRSDFLGAFQKSEAWLDVRPSTLSLGAMSPEAIARAIEGPARVAGLDLQPGLVQAMVADAARGDALPLVAYALHELYERSVATGRLTVQTYRQELGGLDGAVARVAEDLLDSERLTPAQQGDLRRLFLSMARLTEERRFARQEVALESVPGSIAPLVARLVAARLLVADVRTVEVAHEALFESWQRYREWLDQAREMLRMRREIQRDAASWEEAGRSEEFLWRGARLARARELVTAGDLALSGRDEEFLRASERAALEKAEAEERGRRRRLRTAAGVAIGASVLAVLAVVFAVLAQRARGEARVQAVAAEARAREAEIERLRALSAQNFAEHERVKARAEAAEPDSDPAKALAAIAPKYLTQSRLHAARARELEAGLADWRRSAGAAAPPPTLLFSLEMLEAGAGSSILLHYGPPAAPRFVLVDGGGPRVYRRVLRPRLVALRERWAPGQKLVLDLVVSSQTDDAHLRGLLDLTEELATGGDLPVELGALWSNAILPGSGQAALTLAGTQPKTRIVARASELGITVNRPFSHLVTLPEAGAARVHWPHGLSIVVMGPPVGWLREFADWWLQRMEDRLDAEDDTDARRAALAAIREFDILETFSSPRVELLPSPIEIVQIAAPAGRERSLANLASIVLMVELGGKRVLLPADARGDVLLRALAQAGYPDVQGVTPVDVLALPHGGSDQNVSVDFFRRVPARHYLVQSEGRHDNPEVRTFEMLFTARRGDRRPFTIHFNHSAEEMLRANREYPMPALCALFASERSKGTLFDVVSPAADQTSVGLDLLVQSGLRRGLRNAFCPASV